MLLQTCTIPITVNRSVEEYRVLFQTPHFTESIRFMTIRGQVLLDGVPISSAYEQAVFAEVAGRIPTLHRLQWIEMSRLESSILLLDAIFRSAFNKPMKLVLGVNTYPVEYNFPGQDLKIHHIEAYVTNADCDNSDRATIARAFLPRLVSACAATLSSLHIYDDYFHTKMWDLPSVRLKSLTALAAQDQSLVAFLRSQVSLEELTVRMDDSLACEWASWLSASDLPNLRSVTAAYESLRKLVPGRPIREANPQDWSRFFLNQPDAAQDFFLETCPSAAGNGVESVDLGAVLAKSISMLVLSESLGSLSNIRNLGITCGLQVRQSHALPEHFLRPWKGIFTGFYLLQEPPEADLSLSP